MGADGPQWKRPMNQQVATQLLSRSCRVQKSNQLCFLIARGNSCLATKLCRKPRCHSNRPINVSSRGNLILQRKLQGLWFLHIPDLSPDAQNPMSWDLIRCHDQINSQSDLAPSRQGLRGSWIVLFFYFKVHDSAACV